MSGTVGGVAGFALDAALLMVMIAMFVRARRLAVQLRDIGRDREELRGLFSDIGDSIAAAVLATTRLRAESDKSAAELAVACRAANEAGERLATLTLHAVMPAKPASLIRTGHKAPVSPAMVRSLPSRAERDLAQALSGDD